MKWKNKKEGISELALNTHKWTKIRELKKQFEKRTNMKVSSQRIHQVLDDLEEEGKIETKIEERGGNKIRFFRNPEK